MTELCHNVEIGLGDGGDGSGQAPGAGATDCSLVDPVTITAAVCAVLDAFVKTPAEVAVSFVGEQQIAALNARFRQQDAPTNVLSFPDDVPTEGGRRFLGDVVICLPVTKREAAEQHKTPAAHLSHLLVHGALHLLGYDHKIDSEALHMESVEKDILETLGFADPYAIQTGS